MLEHSCLCIDSWTEITLAGTGLAWIKHVSDSAKNPVGFVRLHGKVESFWFSWLRKVRLEVFETADASHLMSLERAWGMLQLWQIYDAEERHVGCFNPPRILDSLGACRGMLEQEREQGRILGPDSQALARYHRTSSSLLELTFTTQPTANPFLRMLLLGCILSLEPMPK